MDEDLRIAVYELQQRVAALEAALGIGTPGGAAAPPSAPVGPAADPEVRGLIESGRTVDAIKVWRERSGLGLVEAKYAVEQAAAQLR